MQPIANIAAPLRNNNSRLEGAYNKLPFLRGLVRLEDVVLLWEVSVDIFCPPWRGIQHFMRKIRRIGTPQLQERFLAWVSERRAALAGSFINGFRDLRVVPQGDSDSDSDEEQPEDTFGFLESNYENLSHVIMIVRWVREDRELFELLENGPGKPSVEVDALLYLARSESRVSVRELTNNFPDETTGDIADFLVELFEKFNYTSHKSFETMQTKTRICSRDCDSYLLQTKEEGAITLCAPAAIEMDLQTYLQYHLKRQEAQENPCTNCGNAVSIETQTFLNNYYVLKIPKPAGETVTLGTRDEYMLDGHRFRISLLIQENDGLYTGWIKQEDSSYSYHHEEIETDNCPLPMDLTNIVLIIFVRSQ